MYDIEKKTPAGRWHTIHRDYDREDAARFMEAMGQGGYDQSGTDGQHDAEALTASHYEGGDLIEYRAVESDTRI